MSDHAESNALEQRSEEQSYDRRALPRKGFVVFITSFAALTVVALLVITAVAIGISRLL